MNTRIISLTEKTVTVEKQVLQSLSQIMITKRVTLPRIDMHIRMMEGQT